MFEVVVGEDTLWVSHGDFDGTGVLQAFVVESDWSLALEKKRKIIYLVWLHRFRIIIIKQKTKKPEERKERLFIKQ